MNTTKHCNADAQSRLPVLTETQESNEETYHATLCIEQEINSLHVRCKEVQRGTVKEITLKVVVSGWPASSNNKSKNLLAYSIRRKEILIYSMYQGCLLRGIRVIISQDQYFCV